MLSADWIKSGMKPAQVAQRATLTGVATASDRVLMNQLPAVIIDGILYASWMFIIAVGLTLIYGVMKILNVAHGSLYALGAYTGEHVRRLLAGARPCADGQLRCACW